MSADLYAGAVWHDNFRVARKPKGPESGVADNVLTTPNGEIAANTLSPRCYSLTD